MADKTKVTTSSAHLNVVSEIPVTKSSTTSRVLLNNPLLRVVVFAIDAGELLTEHSSPRAVVVQLIDGTMDFTIGAATHQMVPGDVIYLAPDEPHSLVATSACHLSLVMVDVASMPDAADSCKTK